MFKQLKKEVAQEQAGELLPWRQALDKVDTLELWDGKLKDLDLSKLPSAQPKVIIFVSSTFTDTKAERNHLMKDVYPFLRSLCRRLGVEFGTVDMRWGVTEEATLEHSTVEMCVNEIERCIKDSVGPSFLCLLGHKYGYRPLPAQIEKTEFDAMLKYLEKSPHDTKMIKNYYTIDNNAVPAEYVLKPRTKENATWWDDSDVLLEQTREAAVACFGRESKKCDKYHISVTETEIHHGAFLNPDNKGQAHFVRRDLDSFASDFHIDRKITDLDAGKVDTYAQEKLQELKDKKIAEFKPPNMLDVKYSIANTEHISNHVRRLCDFVCKTIADGILSNYEQRLHFEEDRVCQEILQHAEHAIEKADLFVGRDNEIKTTLKYLTSQDKTPLVVHGQSGCGKTALMAVIANKAKEQTSKGVVVLRFLGTTGQSGSARLLLLNLCSQISRVYDKDLSLIPTSYKELIAYFRVCLGFATNEKRLTVILDSLDQLSNEDFGQNLAWLSLSEELPDNVKLIVSSLPTKCLDILKRHLKSSIFVEVKPLSLKEGPAIVKKMLGAKNRKVNDDQMKVIMETFKKCPLPLFLRLVVDVALRWKSYDKVNPKDLASDIPGLITKLFDRLESRYGEVLVKHALGYITAAKNGLSLAELEDILSCNDTVLESIFKYWTPPVRRIPPLLWARIRNELGIYLAERGTDGVSAYNWYHRQFWETAEKRYMSTTKDGKPNPFVKDAYEAIADYFGGKWTNGKPYTGKDGVVKNEDRKVPKQPLVIGDERNQGTKRQLNRRKLTELPFHFIKLQDWESFKGLVLDLKYIEAKFEAGDGYNCLSELIEAAKTSDVEEFTKLARFVGSNLGFLVREPVGVYQIASQHTKGTLLRDLLEKISPESIPISLMVNMHESAFSDPCEVTLNGHTESVRCCDYSPKGDLILSSSDDTTMRLWDATTGAELVTVTSLPKPLPVPPEEGTLVLHPVNPCCFGPSGEKIASGTELGEVMLWDTSGAQLSSTKTGNKAVVCVQFSPDGKNIATAFKNSVVMVWNSSTLDLVSKVLIEWSDSPGEIQIEPDDAKGKRRGQRKPKTNFTGWSICTCLDYSKDGKNLAVMCIKGLVLIDTTSYTIRSLTTGKCYQNLCCAYHPSGKQIMSGGDDSCVSIWNHSDGQFVTRLRQHNAWIWNLKFTQDGMHMFTCSSDRTMKVWSAVNDSWDVVATVGGHSHRVCMVSLEPGRESKMVTSSLDRSLKIWNTESLLRGEVLPVGGMHYLVCSTSPDGRFLAMAQGWSRMCDILKADDANSEILTKTPTHVGFVKQAVFSPDSSTLFILDYGHTGTYDVGAVAKAMIVVFNVGDFSIEPYTIPIPSPSTLDVGNDYIVVGTSEGHLKLFDIESRSVKHEWIFGNGKLIQGVAVSHQSNKVAACTEKDCIIWKINSNKTTTKVKDVVGHDSHICVMAFSPDGKMLVTGVNSGKLFIWDTSSDNVTLHSIKNEHAQDYIKDITFSASGNYCATSAGSNLRIWDVRNDMQLLCTYYAPTNCASFLNDNVVIAGEATGNKKYLQFGKS
ncbi:hypothetical protein ACF0H5_015519 [Mactra antiquata]